MSDNEDAFATSHPEAHAMALNLISPITSHLPSSHRSKGEVCEQVILTMKVVLLALLTATLLSGNWGGEGGRKGELVFELPSTQLAGVTGVTVRIRVYNATGELDIRRDPVTLGTRILLICDVTRLPEDSEAVNYRWYHNCPELPNSRCEIQERDPYYRVVKDTLLVDVTSLDQGGKYYCIADSLPVRKATVTRELAVAG